MQTDLMKEHYEKVNNQVNRIILYTLIFHPIVLLLNLLKIFISPWIHVIFNSSFGIIIVLITAILRKTQVGKKYYHIIGISAISLIAISTYSLFSKYVTLFLFIPLVISTLYLNKSLLKVTMISFFPLFIAGDLINILIVSKSNTLFTVPIHIGSYGIAIIMSYLILSKMLDNSLSSFNSIEQAFKDTTTLQQDTMEAAVFMEQSISEISKNITEEVCATENMSKSVQDIVINANNFLKNFNETKVTTEGISSTINKTLENLTLDMNSTRTIERIANESTIKLQNFLDKIKHITELSEKLTLHMSELQNKTQIIQDASKNILGISNQTNMLALNASIEAARSGEAGKGFSIIAQEVRKLSTTTEQYSNEIQSIIESLNEEIISTQHSMKESNESIEGGIKLASEIALSFNDLKDIQGKLTESINKNINDFSKIDDNSRKITEVMDKLMISNKNITTSLEGLSSIIEEFAASSAETNQHINSIEHEVGSLMGSNLK